MTIRRLFAGVAATLALMERRAATALLLMLLTTASAWSEDGVTYMDADGTAHTQDGVTVINSSNMPTSLAEGWYVVTENVNYTSKITLYGDVTLILANGITMNIATSDFGIYRDFNQSLTIYGQSLDAATAGTLSYDGSYGIEVNNYTQHSGNVSITVKATLATNGIRSSSVTLNGGKLAVSANSPNVQAIYAKNANGGITINGGQLDATATGESGDIYALRSQGNITLGSTRATDYIHATNYSVYEGKTVSIKSGQMFLTDDTTPIIMNSGTVSDLTAINGKMLTPVSASDFAETATDTYTIGSPFGWGVFCDALQDNTTWNRFSGKTVCLGKDIEVSRMAGSQYHDFCGTFDGDGHTLTFNRGTSTAYTNDEYTAPFHYVSTVTPEGGEEVPAAIKNLHVTGDIYTLAKYAAGIVGQHWGTLNIENCRNSIVIHSSVSGDGTHGGIEAVSNGVLNITGCVFDGKLLTTGTTATTNCGGFVGWRAAETITITNSLYAPATIGEGETEVGPGVTGQHPSATFARDAATTTKCYYTRKLGTAQGKALLAVTAGENVTVAVSPVGSPVENGTYSVSGITAYAKGITRTVGQATTFYYGSGDVVSLTLGNTTPQGYALSGYEASKGTLTGTENPYTLTMPDEDVVINGLWEQQGVSLTIGSSGWATWYDTKSYTLSEGATAYYVSSVGSGEVQLTAIEGGVPANVPVLISGSGEVTLTEATEAITLSGTRDEQFKGTPTALSATDFTDYFADRRTYVLYGGKFLLVEQNSGIGAHKCWLTLSGSSASRSLKPKFRSTLV